MNQDLPTILTNTRQVLICEYFMAQILVIRCRTQYLFMYMKITSRSFLNQAPPHIFAKWFDVLIVN